MARVSLLRPVRLPLGPLAAGIVTLILGIIFLRLEGRFWVCTCGSVRLWTGDVWSAENSQQLFDPYTFTHLLHGILFCGMIVLLLRNLPPTWQFVFAIVIETVWEVIENSPIVIQRYREATAALGYQGDTVLNSVGDILACGLGFVLARYLGWRKSLFFFVAVELCLVLVIRDSLILNILMLLYPIDAIKSWQSSQ